MVQAKLEQLQADSEASLAALRLEAQGKIAEAQQQANDRSPFCLNILYGPFSYIWTIHGPLWTSHDPQWTLRGHLLSVFLLMQVCAKWSIRISPDQQPCFVP